MTVKSLRVLCPIIFPSQTFRFWDGSGPYLDLDGNVWAGCALGEALDAIETALNGEAYSFPITLSGVAPAIGNLAASDIDEVIGSRLQFLIQECDQYDQPDGDPEVRFTGEIDDMVIDDFVEEDNPVSSVTLQIVNRFGLRNLTSGSVLSDIDQKLRSARLNPGGNPDRIAERTPKLADKTIRWPKLRT